jgi:hypothetical protein
MLDNVSSFGKIGRKKYQIWGIGEAISLSRSSEIAKVSKLLSYFFQNVVIYF